MAGPKESRAKLLLLLKKEGYINEDTTEDTFNTSMDDAEYRHMLWNDLSEDKMYTKTIDDFASQFAGDLASQLKKKEKAISPDSETGLPKPSTLSQEQSQKKRISEKFSVEEPPDLDKYIEKFTKENPDYISSNPAIAQAIESGGTTERDVYLNLYYTDLSLKSEWDDDPVYKYPTGMDTKIKEMEDQRDAEAKVRDKRLASGSLDKQTHAALSNKSEEFYEGEIGGLKQKKHNYISSNFSESSPDKFKTYLDEYIKDEIAVKPKEEVEVPVRELDVRNKSAWQILERKAAKGTPSAEEKDLPTQEALEDIELEKRDEARELLEIETLYKNSPNYKKLSDEDRHILHHEKKAAKKFLKVYSDEQIAATLDELGLAGTERAETRTYLLQKARNEPLVRDAKIRTRQVANELGIDTPEQVMSAYQKETSDVLERYNKQVADKVDDMKVAGKEMDDQHKKEVEAYHSSAKNQLTEFQEELQGMVASGQMDAQKANDLFDQRQTFLQSKGVELYKAFVKRRTKYQSNQMTQMERLGLTKTGILADVEKLKSKYNIKGKGFTKEYMNEYQAVWQTVVGEEEYKNRVKKDLEWDNMEFSRKIAVSLKKGASSLLESAGLGVKWFAPGLDFPDLIIEDIADFREGAATKDYTGYTLLEKIASPEFLMTTALEQLPIMAPMMGASAAAFKASTGLMAKFGGISAKTRIFAASLAGGASSRFVESRMEEWNVVQNKLTSGATWEEAYESGRTVRNKNLALMAFDSFQTYIAFGKKPVQLITSKGFKKSTTMQSIMGIGKDLGLTFASGASEELLQEYWSALEFNPMLELSAFAMSEEGKEIMAIGGLMEMGFALNGALNHRSGLSSVNDRFTSFFDDMKVDEVGLGDMENRSQQLIHTLEHLKAREMLEPEEYTQAMNAINQTVENFKKSFNGDLPFSWKDDRLKKYAAFSGEAEAIRVKAEALPKSKKHEKEILENRAKALDKEVDRLFAEPDGYSYAIDGVPMSKSEFESIVNNPKNLSQLEGHRIDTDDVELRAKLIGESGLASERIKTIETAKTFVEENSEGMGVDYAIQLAEKQAEKQKEVVSELEGAKDSEYREAVQKEREIDALLQGLGALKAEEKATVSQAVEEKESQLLDAATDHLSKERVKVRSVENIEKSVSELEGKNESVIGEVFDMEAKMLLDISKGELIEEVDGNPTKEYLDAKVAIAKKKQEVRANNETIQGLNIMAREEAFKKAAAPLEVDEATEVVEAKEEGKKEEDFDSKDQAEFEAERKEMRGRKPTSEEFFNLVNRLPDGTVIKGEEDDTRVVVKKQKTKKGTENVWLESQLKNEETGEWEVMDVGNSSKKADGSFPKHKIPGTFTDESLTFEKPAKEKTVPEGKKEEGKKELEQKAAKEKTVPEAKYPMEEKGKWWGDEDYKSRGGVMTEMTPDEFLSKAKPLEMDEETRENVDDIKRHIEEGRKLDPLALYGDDVTDVKDSDGRHRAIAAKELGMKVVPVLDFTSKKEKSEKPIKQKKEKKATKESRMPIEDTSLEDAGLADAEATNEVATNEDAQADRDRGYRVVDGKKVVRQDPITNKVVGRKAKVLFGRNARTAKGITVDAEYTIVEASEFQPSHKTGTKNQKFFIDEAQPRDRSKPPYNKQDEIKGANLNPFEFGMSPNAFFGAPVTNERGEIIQGNGRGGGLQWYYRHRPNDRAYQEWLLDNADSFGIDVKALAKMKQPVLVRMVKAEDAEAIRLGNMKSEELEDVTRKGETEAAALRVIPTQQKAALAEIILEKSKPTDTINEAARAGGRQVLDYMIKIKMLRSAKLDQYLTKRGAVNADGVALIQKTLKAMLFQGTTNEDFASMDDVHGNIRAGIERAMIGLLTIENDRVLNQEISNIVDVLGDFYSFKKKNPKSSLDNWLSQGQLGGGSARDRLSANEQAIAEFLTSGGELGKVPTSKQIAAKLQQYVADTKASKETLFEPAKEGLTKREAIKRIFPSKVFDKPEGSKATNTKGLYNIYRDLFGLSRVKALGAAIVTDASIKQMAKRAGISKKEMYAKIEFRKGDARTVKELKEGKKALFQGKDGAKNFKKWKGNAKALDPQDAKTGQPVVMELNHGTTNMFYEFDASVKGNIEAHLGKVNYFTNSNQDAENNYGSEGPDITSRIEQEAEQIERFIEDFEDSEGNLNYDDLSQELGVDIKDIEGKDAEEIAKQIATERLDGGDEKVLEVFVKLNNPLVLGSGAVWREMVPQDAIDEYMDEAAEYVAEANGITVEEALEDYDYEVRDEALALSGAENEIREALKSAIEDNAYNWEDADSIVSEIMEDFWENEVNLQDLEAELRKHHIENEDGQIATSQVIGEFFKNLGYDGIILNDVSNRFPGMGLNSGDSHVHVFDEYANQIKLSDGSNTTFGETKDIRFQDEKGAMLAEDSKFIIYALTDPNVSTPLHEIAHIFEHYLTDKEKKTVQKWAKTKEWNRETSEKFARGFEKYISTGKSPFMAMKKVFDKFKGWMTDIYNGIVDSEIDIELNSAMEKIYTSMLGDAVKPPTKKGKQKKQKREPGNKFDQQYSTRKMSQTKKDKVDAKRSIGSAAHYSDSPTQKDFPIKPDTLPRSAIEEYKKNNRGMVPKRVDTIKGVQKSLSFLFKGMKFTPRIFYNASRRRGVMGSISGVNMRVKISQYAHIPTIIHELAHWIDMGLGITKNAKDKLDQELSQFWDFGSTPPGATAEAKSGQDFWDTKAKGLTVEEAIKKGRASVEQQKLKVDAARAAYKADKTPAKEQKIKDELQKVSDAKGVVQGLKEIKEVHESAALSLKGKGVKNPTQKQIVQETVDLQQDYRRMEGFAMFAEGFMVNPMQAKEMAPKTYEAMKSAITAQKGGEKRWESLENASYDIRMIYSLNADEAAQSTSQETYQQYKQRAPMERAKITMDKFMGQLGIGSVNGEPNLSFFDVIQVYLSNDKKALKVSMEKLFKMNGMSKDDVMKGDVDQNFYLLSLLMAGKNDKAREMLEKSGIRRVDYKEGTRGYKKVKSEEGEAITIGWLLQPLSDNPNFSKMSRKERLIALDSDKELAARYMTAQRTIELAERFEREENISGMSVDQYTKPDLQAAQEYLEWFDKNVEDSTKNRINEYIKRYRKMSDTTLRYAVDSGLISEETYAEIKEKNAYYVALHRIFEDEVGHVLNPNGYGSGQKVRFEKIKGSARDRKDSVESLIATFYATINRADDNYMNNRFIDLIRGDMTGGTPMPLEKFGVQVQVKEGSTVPDGVMTIWKDGKPEYWKVDPDIGKAFGVIRDLSSYNDAASATADRAMWLMEHTIGLQPKATQFFTTRFPIFARVINPTRDFIFRHTVSRVRGWVGSGAKNKLTDALKIKQRANSKMAKKLGLSPESFQKLGLEPDEFSMTDSEALELFNMYGGGQSGMDMYLKNDKNYHKAMHRALTDLSKNGSWVPAANEVWPKYNDWLAKGELSNRIAEFKTAYRFFRKQGLNEYAAYKRAAFEARDLCDFAIKGTMMKYLRHLSPFLNANVQGTKRFAKFVKEAFWDGAKQKDPELFTRFMVKTALPSMGMIVMAHAFGYEDEYREKPNYLRDMFMSFKMFPGGVKAFGGEWNGDISIPKPFEVGILGSWFERALDRTVYGNEKAFDGWWGMFSRGMVPVDPRNPYNFFGSAKSVAEISANWDSFRETTITPHWDDDKNILLKSGAKQASNLGWWLSGGGEWGDPRNADHLVKSWFGYFGNHATKISNLIGEREVPAKASQSYSFSTEGFMQELKLYRHTSVYSLKVVQRVMNKTKEWQLGTDSDFKVFKGVVKGFAMLPEGTDKKKAVKHIIAVAKEVEKKFDKLIPIYEKYLKGDLKNYKGYPLEGWTNTQVRNLIFN